MYRREFDNLIGAKKVPNFVLLRGNDEYLNELYAKILIDYYASENLFTLYYDEYDFSAALSFLEPSLFGGSNTLHIKANKTIKKDEIKKLIEMCKKDENNHLIFELNDEGLQFLNDFIAVFERNDVRFFKPTNLKEVLDLLTAQCRISKIYPNSAALERIYQIHNENLNLCAAEIEKFARLDIELNLDNVNSLVFGLSEVSYDEIFDKIFSLKDFRNDFFRLLQSGGYSEIEFINFIYRSLFRIFKVHLFIKENGRFDIKSAIGYLPPQQIQENLKRLSKEISTHKFLQIFILLNELEFDIKSKKDIDKDSLIISSLLNLQRIIHSR